MSHSKAALNQMPELCLTVTVDNGLRKTSGTFWDGASLLPLKELLGDEVVMAEIGEVPEAPA